MKYDIMKYNIIIYDVIMKYDIMKYEVMKYDVIKYDIMKMKKTSFYRLCPAQAYTTLVVHVLQLRAFGQPLTPPESRIKWNTCIKKAK